MTDKTSILIRTAGRPPRNLRTFVGLVNVEGDQNALRLRQDELEACLLAAPVANWHEAPENARYFLDLFAAALTSEDPR
jgi:hypothetical protein